MRLTNTETIETIQPENEIQGQNERSLFDFVCDSLAVLWKDWPKEMELASTWEGGFRLRGICPHCHRDSAFESVTKSYIEDHTRIAGTRIVGVLRCVACNDYILGILRMVPESTNRYVAIYDTHAPLGEPNDDVPDEIPAEIAADFREALRCRHVDAYNATVEMCRRAVESSCIQLGADPQSSIQAQIDWVFNQGKIIASLRDMAHAIRLAGNRGAHPPRPIIDEEADAVLLQESISKPCT